MNEDNAPNDFEFETTLGNMQPTETTVSKGTVMFEAGRVAGLNSVLRLPSNRLWQLATAGSLLLACGLFANQFRSTDTVSPKSQIAEAVKQDKSTTQVPTQSQMAPELTDSNDAARQAFQKMFASNQQSPISRRREILRQGVAGLPEPDYVISTFTGPGGSPDAASRNDLIEQLLGETY